MTEPTQAKPRGYLRDTMPENAAFIDTLREAFGADQVDPSIRAGMAGIPNKFFASEGGRTIGTPFDGCYLIEITEIDDMDRKFVCSAGRTDCPSTGGAGECRQRAAGSRVTA